MLLELKESVYRVDFIGDRSIVGHLAIDSIDDRILIQGKSFGFCAYLRIPLHHVIIIKGGWVNYFARAGQACAESLVAHFIRVDSYQPPLAAVDHGLLHSTTDKGRGGAPKRYILQGVQVVQVVE